MGGARAAARGLRRALRRAGGAMAGTAAQLPAGARAGAAAPPAAGTSGQLSRAAGLQSRSFHAACTVLGSDCPLPDRLYLPDGSVRAKPEEPNPDDCCGRGCVQCIWTTYTQELQDYQAAVAVTQGFAAPVDPFEALERRLSQQTAQLQDADSQGL